MLGKKKKEEPEHGGGADRYLITYADLITLLLGLFVILYASSQVDKDKFKEYSAAFSEFFKTKDAKILQGGDGILQGHRNGVPEPILNPRSERSIKEISGEIKQKMSEYIEKGLLEVRNEDSGLVLVLPEKLLFRSGKSEVEEQGLTALDSLAKVLSGIKKLISVDGHTDTDPIRTFQFESNWHLSASRAANVAYVLIKDGVPEYNLVIRGFGSQRPIDDNTTPEGKAKNRRVEITITNPPASSPTKEGYVERDTALTQ